MHCLFVRHLAVELVPEMKFINLIIEEITKRLRSLSLSILCWRAFLVAVVRARADNVSL